MKIQHRWPRIDFASFINLVMWNRTNTRVWPGPLGLCFSWQGARGETFAAFHTDEGVVIYRAMDAHWPIQSTLTPNRAERQERLQIGPYRPGKLDPELYLGAYAPQ
jgi:hypothetical protein